jgi:hypothetical protein
MMHTALETLLINALQDILTILNKKNNAVRVIGENADILQFAALLRPAYKKPQGISAQAGEIE